MSKKTTQHSPLPLGIIPHDTLKDCNELAFGTGYERITVATGVPAKYAQFIVSACNSHQALVEALEGLLGAAAVLNNQVCRGVEYYEPVAIVQARAALALAKGGQE